jgi:hypothetical protein
VSGRRGPGGPVGVAESVGVGCVLGLLLSLAATWLSIGPLTGNWADCDAEPGHKFVLVLVLPVVVVVQFTAFTLSYALLRQRTGWGRALAAGVLVLAAVAVVVGQVALAEYGIPEDLCAEWS